LSSDCYTIDPLPPALATDIICAATSEIAIIRGGKETIKAGKDGFAIFSAMSVTAEAFKEIGVKFYRDHSCCNTCGHAEAKAKNYVFYHGQDNDRLRKGDRSVHLAFNFDDETKVKVLELIEKQTCDAIHLHWGGEDHTKIFLTCDVEEMSEHIKEDEERQERMKKIASEKVARRVELLKQLAELDM
jgi:hypothetical protein